MNPPAFLGGSSLAALLVDTSVRSLLPPVSKTPAKMQSMDQGFDSSFMLFW